jgi:hypothetical protein
LVFNREAIASFSSAGRELKTHAAECERLWWIDYFIPPTLGNLVHFRHFNLPSACVYDEKKSVGPSQF